MLQDHYNVDVPLQKAVGIFSSDNSYSMGENNTDLNVYTESQVFQSQIYGSTYTYTVCQCSEIDPEERLKLSHGLQGSSPLKHQLHHT